MYRVWKLTDNPDGVEQLKELSAFNAYENALSLMQEQVGISLILEDVNREDGYSDLAIRHVWNGHREVALPRPTRFPHQ